jgi:hypothetical protein
MPSKLLQSLAFLLITALCGASDPNLYAVLVGLGDYDRSTQGFGKLSGPNDVDTMRQLLESKVKFGHSEIKCLVDRETTTKSAIESTVEKFLLKNPDIKSNDIVVFFYSGHGAQVVLNGKLKQAIVPIDVKRKDGPRSGIVAESVIAGPQIGSWIRALVQKTANVTFIFDACTSAQIARGAGIPKSGEDNPEAIGASPDPFAVGVGSAAVISAADVGETAIQMAGHGVLTSSIKDSWTVLVKAKPKWSYADLMAQVKVAVVAQVGAEDHQHPKLQTGQPDRDFLGSEMNREFGLRVNYTPKLGLVVLNGDLAGLKPGFILHVYGSGSPNFSEQPIAVVEVARLESGTAILDVKSSAISKRDLSGHTALLADGTPDGLLWVHLEDLKNTSNDWLVDRLSALPFVRRGDLGQYDVRITPPEIRPQDTSLELKPGFWSLTAPSGRRLSSVASTPGRANLYSNIQTQLLDALRFKALKSLGPAGTQEVEVEIKLIQLDWDESNKKARGISNEIDQSKILSDGVHFCVAVRAFAPGTSKAPKPAAYNPHLCVWELTPNGRDTRFWPRASPIDVSVQLTANGRWYLLGRKQVNADTGSRTDSLIPMPDNLKLRPEDIQELFTNHFSPSKDGSGEDIFKVLATKEPQDWDYYFSQSMAERPAVSRIGALLRRLATGKPVARDPKTYSSFSVSTCTVVIQPRK